MKYALVHIHSNFSTLDAPSKIKNIVKKAKDIGCPGVSISDHGVAGGLLQAYNECKSQDINFIPGVEFYVNNNRDFKDKTNRKNFHLCLFAKNYEGYKDLIWLQGESTYNFYGKPRTTNELILQKAKKGNLICTTACLGSELHHYFKNNEICSAKEWIKKYYNVFGDDLYLELQINELTKEQKAYNDKLIQISNKTGISLTLGLDSHYVEKEDWFLQQLTFLIRDKKTVKSLESNDDSGEEKGKKDEAWQFETKSLWIKTPEEVIECNKEFGYNYSIDFIKRLFSSTLEINSKVDVEIPFYDYKFPKHKHQGDISSKQLLINKAKSGLKQKLSEGKVKEKDIPTYVDRIKEEIDVLTNHGRDFSDYFLFFDDIKNFVYEQGGMLGAGRGSACASLLLWLLDITKLDPIKDGLIFERFINKARLETDAADLDIDISSDELPLVEEWLKKRYGERSVCSVGNYTKFSIKNTIKDVARALAVDDDLKVINNITKTLNDKSEDVNEEWALAAKRFKKNSREYKWLEKHERDVLKWSSKLVGCIRNVGQHASGLVVVPGELYDHVPLLYHKKKTLTAYVEGVEYRELPQVGVLKLDLLGLSTAAIINNTIKLIKERHDDFPYDQKTIFDIDREDKNILDEFAKGNTDNCFQFESDGMKSLLQNICVSSFSDVVLCNALYRPGALGANMHNVAVENKFKGDDITYVHPKVKGIVEKTYGVPAFQEQVLFTLQKIGNLSLSESDLARKTIKALGKAKKSPEELEKLNAFLKTFAKGAKENGLNDKEVSKILEWLRASSDYSFNKSHSAAYSLNSYITLWLKKNYPIEFFTAVLANVQSNEEKLYTTLRYLFK